MGSQWVQTSPGHRQHQLPTVAANARPANSSHTARSGRPTNRSDCARPARMPANTAAPMACSDGKHPAKSPAAQMESRWW